MFWIAFSILNVCNSIESADFTKCEYVLWYDLYSCLFFSENVQLGYKVHAWSHILTTHYIKRKPNIFQV
jgi:hypothetical protein